MRTLLFAIILCLLLIPIAWRIRWHAFRNGGQTRAEPQPPPIHAVRREPLMNVVYVPLLSRAECATVIALAERQVWRTDRHASYPTTDIAISTVPELERRLLALNMRAIHDACAEFGFRQGELWLRDNFVVKYTPGGQRELKRHRDASEISYVVALNDDYDGGGTAFDQEVPRKLLPGEGILFCGKRLHQGLTTSRGVRYILTGFLDAHVNAQTVASIREANPATVASLGGHWDPRWTIPTRPYLRSNTYRILGEEAATRGNLSAMASSSLALKWPHANLTSTLAAAHKVITRHGTALGEERMHKVLHAYLTDPAECAPTYCHMAS